MVHKQMPCNQSNRPNKIINDLDTKSWSSLIAFREKSLGLEICVNDLATGGSN